MKPQGIGTDELILIKEDPSWFGYSLFVGLDETGKLEGYLGEEGEVTRGTQDPALAESNAWSHIALTFDGARVRLYVNGEFVDDTTAKGPLATTGTLSIGCSHEGEDFFKGRIDEVRVYNRALDAEEIRNGMHPLAEVETTETYGVNANEAAFVGTVDPQGEETTYRFEYGTTTAYGNTAPEDPELTEEAVSGNEVQEVEEPVDTLEPETTYHYRIVATNNRGTVVGRDRTLTTTAATTPLAQLEEERQALLAEKPSWQGFAGLNWSGDFNKTAGVGTMKLVQESGAKMFRVPIGATDKTTDDLFRHAAERGIAILPNIVGVPGTPGNLMPPVAEGKPGRTKWENKLKDIVSRYGPGGTFWKDNSELSSSLAPDYWEIWNEPNYGSNGDLNEHVNPDRYGEILAISHAVITGLKPGAKILFGGLLTVGAAKGQKSHMTVGEFVRRVGHDKDYDALSLHPYAFRGVGKPPNPTSSKDVQHVTKLVERNIRGARMALNRAGGKGKKLWITELGWPVKEKFRAEEDHHHFLVSEEVQRELLNATFNMIKERSGSKDGSFDIENVFYYNVQDHVKGNATPRAWDAHCGLVKDVEEGGKRKAWTAFQNQAK